jgi:hypothetical protein
MSRLWTVDCGLWTSPPFFITAQIRGWITFKRRTFLLLPLDNQAGDEGGGVLTGLGGQELLELFFFHVYLVKDLDQPVKVVEDEVVDVGPELLPEVFPFKDFHFTPQLLQDIVDIHK